MHRTSTFDTFCDYVLFTSYEYVAAGITDGWLQLVMGNTSFNLDADRLNLTLGVGGHVSFLRNPMLEVPILVG